MKETLIGMGFGLVIGAGLMAAYQPKNEPFDIGEAKTILAKLKPYSVNRADTHIFLWADGTVNIAFAPRGGSEFRGSGNSLKEAVADMQSKSELVGKALKE